jgi:hypothetical protein
MNPESSDHLLSKQFRRLRALDELSVPPFADFLGRAPRAKQVGLRRSFVLGLAATACVALVVIALRSHGGAPSDEEFSRIVVSAEPIMGWKEPTKLLLEPPVEGLLRGVPVMGDTSCNINIQ